MHDIDSYVKIQHIITVFCIKSVLKVGTQLTFVFLPKCMFSLVGSKRAQTLGKISLSHANK